MKRKHQLLLIVLIVLAAYSPAFFAGFSAVDDSALEANYRGMKGWDIGNLFIPAVGGGLYYRPLIGLSSQIDRQLFGFNPGIMHLESVLLHLLNAILVYFITLRLLPAPDRDGSMLPLLLSLLFALHPVNTESVNWISGRTDVLAGSFLFASTLFLLKYRDMRRRLYLVLSFVLFLGGAMTKETALAFLPGALLVLSASYGSRSGSGYTEGHDGRSEQKAQHTNLIIGGVVLAVAVLFFFRSAAFTSSASRIGLTVLAITTDWIHSMFVVLRTFGFYLKKLVFPLPLNFAIIEVDPLYEVLAVSLLLLCIYIATRRTVLSALFTMGLLMMAPAFLIAFGQIAWTPFAERYVYLTSAFFVIAAGSWISPAIPHSALSMARVGSLAVVLVLSVITFQRSLIWQNDLKLMRDTVEKTPDYKPLRAIYAMELARKGEYAAAKEQMERGKGIYEPGYDERYDFIMAYIYYNQGKKDEAYKLIEFVVNKTHSTSISALEYILYLLEEKKSSVVTQREVRELEQAIFRHTLRLFALTGNPHLLFDLGVSAERLGDRKRALRLYQQAKNNLRDADPLRQDTLKKIGALQQTKEAHHAEKTL